MPKRLQFSIAFIFIAITAVAIAIAAVVAEPSWISFLVLHYLNACFAATAIISAQETRGRLRAFCIGVTVGLAPSLMAQGIAIAWVLPHTGFAELYAGMAKMAVAAANGERFTLPAIWCLSIPNGLLGVFIYSLFFGRHRGELNGGN